MIDLTVPSLLPQEADGLKVNAPMSNEILRTLDKLFKLGDSLELTYMRDNFSIFHHFLVFLNYLVTVPRSPGINSLISQDVDFFLGHHTRDSVRVFH